MKYITDDDNERRVLTSYVDNGVIYLKTYFVATL